MEVADVLNVDQSAISLWENGKTYPTGQKVIALAKLYGCTTDQLYEPDDGKEESA